MIWIIYYSVPYYISASEVFRSNSASLLRWSYFILKTQTTLTEIYARSKREKMKRSRQETVRLLGGFSVLKRIIFMPVAYCVISVTMIMSQTCEILEMAAVGCDKRPHLQRECHWLAPFGFWFRPNLDKPFFLADNMDAGQPILLYTSIHFLLYLLLVNLKMPSSHFEYFNH